MMPHLRTHRWNLSDAGFQQVLRNLSFRYHKWDLTVDDHCRILPESIVLSAATHEHLVRVTEAFAAAIRRFESAHRTDPALAAALGIPASLVPLMAAESPRESAFCRADFFLTPDNRWVISEFNEDVPGGFNEAVGIPELVDAATLGGRVPGSLKNRLVESFRDCPHIGMVFATAFSEDLQHSALLGQWLEDAGHTVVLGSPEQLTMKFKPRLAGQPVDGAFRFYPGEWMALLPNLAAWRHAVPRLRMMSPPVRLLAQSKSSFALWQTTHPLDPADQWLCDDLLPHTECFQPGQATRYRAEREAWVLKRAFGRMGDAVLIGALSPPSEWEASLAAARQSPHEYCMQARFQVEPLTFEAGRMYPTIGAYAVDGRFAGYYSRVAPQPFITSEAYHVATVVEAA